MRPLDKPARRNRWFIYSLIGLFIFLCGGIVFTAVALLRRGKLPRVGIVAGSSMEPILPGPRFVWSCPKCLRRHEFALDACKNGQPIRCEACGHLDRESEVDFDDPESLTGKILPGVQVRFSSLRAIREARTAEIESGTAQSSGIRRGDIVVFQESLGAKRELKRVVGFPFERVAIEQGDIFVNGMRWHKSLEESLRQSILVDAWDGTKTNATASNGVPQSGRWMIAGREFTGVIEMAKAEPSNQLETNEQKPHALSFSYEPPRWIDNRLAVNAHDSHAIVPVSDFGVAWQLSQPAISWKIRCSFHHSALEGVQDPAIELDRNGNKIGIRYGEQSAVADLPEQLDQSIWIALAMVDGFLIAGNQEQEWMRIELPTKGDSSGMVRSHPAVAPITIVPISGKMVVDQLLVFRDIYYRGSGDSDSQTWEPSSQVIVLGDNVSISTDSRDRWPDGLSESAIKGVVLQTESPMEILLRQR